MSVTSFAKRPIHRQHAAGQRPVVQVRRVADGDRPAAEDAWRPDGSPEPAVPSVIAMIRRGPFAASASADHRRDGRGRRRR